MKLGSDLLWNMFKESLFKEINTINKEQLVKAWDSCKDRSNFYFDFLFPRIANELGLEYKKEAVFRFDGVMFKKAVNGQPVPIIYIESENDAKSTVREVYKLCSLNAPLKLLFICQLWSQERKEELMQDFWIDIIDAFKNEIGLVGSIGFINAESRDGRLRFHLILVNEDGERVEDIENFISVENE